MEKKKLKAIATAIRAIASLVEKFEPAPAYEGGAKLENESWAEYGARIAAEALEHGDGETANRKAVFKLIQSGYMDTVAKFQLGDSRDVLKGIRETVKANESAGKVSATESEFIATAEGAKGARADLLPLWEKAAELRESNDGKRTPWSEIRDSLNLTDGARIALYNAARKFPELFTEHKPAEPAN
jgi:hypothetical protein